jgi:FkbM family methyltransferase
MIADRALALVRQLARVPGFRRLTRSSTLLRLSFALRATLVRERLTFIRLELFAHTPVSATHHIRETGVPFRLRHRTTDVLMLDEIFAQREYELPTEIVELLQTKRPLRVLDLGANIGLFGVWILGYFDDARITSVEAHSENAAVVSATIAATGRRQTWKLIEGAATTHTGTAKFVRSGYPTSHLARNTEIGADVVNVVAVDALEYARDADLLKIDIEGGEWPILDDPRFAQLPTPVVVLEYHPDGCPSKNPRAAVGERLQRAGYGLVSVRAERRHGTGVIWAARD